MKKEAPGVEKKSEQRYEHSLEIPDLPSSDKDVSSIIHISYVIRVEAKIAGLFKNLIESIPLTVATVGVRDAENTAAPPQPMGLIQMPMPMPGLGSWYPSLDTSQLSLTSLGMNLPTATAADSSLPPYTSEMYTNDQSLRPQNSSTPNPPPRHRAEAGFRSSLPPTAPPLDFTSGSPNSTRSSICSQQWDTPPTYDEVFGSPAHSMTSSHHSTVSAGGSGNNGTLPDKTPVATFT